MFVVLLKFSDRRDEAGRLMESHKAWIERGLEDGVFVLVGSLPPGLGGGILAHGLSRAELERRIGDDPFVAEQVVTAEIIELAPARADERLDFLLA